MKQIASRKQLQLLATINSLTPSLSQLKAFLTRSRSKQVVSYLASLFDCIRSEFVAWDGPCLSLTTTGSAVLAIAVELKQGNENPNYCFAYSNLVYRGDTADEASSVSAISKFPSPVLPG